MSKKGARTPLSIGRGAKSGAPEKPAAEEKLNAPSRGAWAALGPYARSRLAVHALGKSLALDVPGDVFSTQRIDEGTQLLLSHLPARAPASLLDLGCGYGALGLPVAAKFPDCRALLVDRDLLAVAASAYNAQALGLTNVEARPSLGFRDLARAGRAGLAAAANAQADERAASEPSTSGDATAPERFDWLLCNVPARIGIAAIGHFLQAGRALLTSEGELRIVVIRDLVPVVREAAAAHGLAGEHALTEVVHGPRHSVFALAANPDAPAIANSDAQDAGNPGARDAASSAPDSRSRDAAFETDPDAIYARDQSQLPIPHGPHAPGISIARPHDASEDPRHADALALLFSALPRIAPELRAAPKRAFAFRCGFGGAALASLLLYPEIQVVSQERDLLDQAFLIRNARALGAADRLDARAALFPGEAARGETFPLVIGELSPSAGDGVALREVKEARAMLAPRGQALLLAPKKSGEVIVKANAGFTLLLERGPFSVWRA